MNKHRLLRIIKNAGMVLLGAAAALALLAQRPASSPGAAQLATGAQAAQVQPQTGATPTPPPSGTGVGYDPLTPQEQNQALTIASNAGAVASELLLIERHEEDKAVYNTSLWPRRADVYSYDYSQDTLIQAVVDLTASSMSAVIPTQNVQLQISPNESMRAVTLALADPVVGPTIRDQYYALTGTPLGGPTQLVTTALAFRADSMPTTQPSTIANCGINRCAQLLLAVPGGRVLDAQPVVNLTTGAVAGGVQ